MQYYEWLLIAAGVAGAILSIWKATEKIYKTVKKCISFFTDLKKQVAVIEQHCKENYMRELQIIIMSEEMPLDERLRAGEEYVDNGGNGAIKAKYRVLLQKYNDEQAHEQNNK